MNDPFIKTYVMNGSFMNVTFTPADDEAVVDFEHGGWVAGNAAWRNKFQEWPRILDKYARFTDQAGVKCRGRHPYCMMAIDASS